MSTADHAGRPVRPSSAGRGPYSDGGNAGAGQSGGGALRRLADGGSSSSAPARETTRPVPASGGAAGGSSSGSASTSAIPKYPAGYTSRTGDEAGVAREQAREARRERPPATQPQPQQQPRPVQREAQPNGRSAPPAPTAPVPAAAAGAAVTPAPETHPLRRNEGQVPSPVRPAPSRRVRLTVSRIDPWSAMKMSFLLSVALGIAGVVMVSVLWTVLEGMGVFDQVNGVIGQVIQDDGQGFDILDFVGFTRVVSLSIVIGVVDVILITAVATLGAFLYNVSSALVGGVQLTLTDD